MHKILEPLLPLFQRQKSSCPSALFSIAIIVPTSSSSSSSYFSLSTTPSNLNPPTSLLLLTSHYTKKKKKIKKKMNKSSIFPPLPSCVVVVVGWRKKKNTNTKKKLANIIDITFFSLRPLFLVSHRTRVWYCLSLSSFFLGESSVVVRSLINFASSSKFVNLTSRSTLLIAF